jgi:O-antigen ligase
MVIDEISAVVPRLVGAPVEVDQDGADGPSARTVTGRWSIGRVVVAALGLAVASSAPSVVLGVHILHEPVSFESWEFAYPLSAVAVLGVALLWQDLARYPVRSWPLTFWPLAGLVAWSLASVWWSVSPELTTSRSTIAVGIAAFGVWFGRLRFRDQLRAVTAFAVLATIGSWAAIIAWPAIGRSSEGVWQGVFASPNSLGPAAVVGVLVAAAHATRRRTVPSVVASLVLGVANLVLLAKTSSITAQTALVASVAVGIFVAGVWAVRDRGVSGRVVGSGAVVLGVAGFVAIVPNMGRIAGALGQDPTLASRTVIWEDMRRFIAERPIRGYGYWAFWDNLDYSWGSYNNVGRYYGSAHDSFFEMALGLGAVGAGLFGLVVLGALFNIGRLVWIERSLASMAWAVLLGAVLVEHLTESFVLWHSYVWILLIAAAFVRPNRQHESSATA